MTLKDEGKGVKKKKKSKGGGGGRGLKREVVFDWRFYCMLSHRLIDFFPSSYLTPKPTTIRAKHRSVSLLTIKCSTMTRGKHSAQRVGKAETLERQ